jgi:glycosidase
MNRPLTLIPVAVAGFSLALATGAGAAKPAPTPPPAAPEKPQLIVPANEGTRVEVRWGGSFLELTFLGEGVRGTTGVYAALDTSREGGSFVMPFGQGYEGSTVFLPLQAERVVFTRRENDTIKIYERGWNGFAWGERSADPPGCLAEDVPGGIRLRIYRPDLGPGPIGIATWLRDTGVNDGWGHLWGACDPGVAPGTGDRSIARHFTVDFTNNKPNQSPALTRRFQDPAVGKPRIYQMLVRLFSNTNPTRKSNGTLAENGSGKFEEINDAALDALKAMGITHLWLCGVPRQATGTDHPTVALGPDDPDLLKGIAGSPYAVKDWFDVCPDYAGNSARRMDEFKALLARIRAKGMRSVIDFVPNHVARSYDSSGDAQTELGAADDATKFFAPNNNFFWLRPTDPGGGPPLRLPTVDPSTGAKLSPTCKALNQGDGLFDPEKEKARVTGNNAPSWRPTAGDWYETAKLNYGFDFTDPARNTRAYPNAAQPKHPIPDTWYKMDRVIAFWQEAGVDGFRCDMAHMVPPEFWHWLIGRARGRNAKVYFFAEAYDLDPNKVPGTDPVVAQLNDGKGNVMFDLLNAGFDSVYDDPTYDRLKEIYDGNAWANDLDALVRDPFLRDHSLRYAENHDEVRLSARGAWGGVGMEVGRPVSAILLGLSAGPALVYHGQEVGEPGAGEEGFSGDDGRTSIFDYWSMPELARWVNGHKYDGGGLAPAQKELRAFHARLLQLLNEPAFREGAFIPLNAANGDNAGFGRLQGESASGHWLYAFLRTDPVSRQRFLVAVNLHRSETLKDVRIRIPEAALSEARIDPKAAKINLTERLTTSGALKIEAAPGEVVIPEIPPLTPYYLEIGQP